MFRNDKWSGDSDEGKAEYCAPFHGDNFLTRDDKQIAKPRGITSEPQEYRDVKVSQGIELMSWLLNLLRVKIPVMRKPVT